MIWNGPFCLREHPPMFIKKYLKKQRKTALITKKLWKTVSCFAFSWKSYDFTDSLRNGFGIEGLGKNDKKRWFLRKIFYWKISYLSFRLYIYIYIFIYLYTCIYTHVFCDHFGIESLRYSMVHRRSF